MVMPCSRSARRPSVRLARLIWPAAGDVGGALERLDLILHQRFRIVEQAADEGGFAVVDTAAGVEAQDVDRDVGAGGERHEIFVEHQK
jgi:hypothetical protein